MEMVLDKNNGVKRQKPSGNADNALARRFSAAANPFRIEYEITGDIALLHQYSAICANPMPNNLWGINDVANGHTGTLLLAYRGKQCLGGAQINISYPRQFRTLPCEQQGFSLQKYLPELELYNVVYGEISDFVGLPEYQTVIAEELFNHAVNEAINQGAQYMFMVSTMPQAGRCGETAQRLGLRYSLRPDVELPDYEEYAGGRAVLTMLDLTMPEKNAHRRDTSKARHDLSLAKA